MSNLRLTAAARTSAPPAARACVLGMAAVLIMPFSACRDAAVEPPTPPVVVTLAPAALTLEVGEARPLTALVTNVPPARPADVDFRSSNTAIATVDGAGTVRGVSVGQATVTALARADTTAKASADITVTAAPVQPGIDIVSVTNARTGQPVAPASTSDSINITLAVQLPVGVQARVEVRIGDVVVADLPVTGAGRLNAAEGIGPTGLVQDPLGLVSPVNTAAFDPTTGAARFPNGPHNILARIIGPQGTVLANAPPGPFTQLVFNNNNYIVLTTSATRGPVAGPTGEPWFTGDLTVTALPVNFGGPSDNTAAMTLRAQGTNVAASVTDANTADGFVFVFLQGTHLVGANGPITLDVVSTTTAGGQPGTTLASGETIVPMDNVAPVVLRIAVPEHGWTNDRFTLQHEDGTPPDDAGGVGGITTEILAKTPDGLTIAIYTVGARLDLGETPTNDGIRIEVRAADALGNRSADVESARPIGVDLTPPSICSAAAGGQPGSVCINPGATINPPLGATFRIFGNDVPSDVVPDFLLGRVERFAPGVSGADACPLGPVDPTGECEPIVMPINNVPIPRDPGYMVLKATATDQAGNVSDTLTIVALNSTTNPAITALAVPAGETMSVIANFTAAIDLKLGSVYRVFTSPGATAFLPLGEQVLDSWGPPLRTSLNVTFNVAYVRGAELTSPTHVPEGLVTTAGGWYARMIDQSNREATRSLGTAPAPAPPDASSRGVRIWEIRNGVATLLGNGDPTGPPCQGSSNAAAQMPPGIASITNEIQVVARGPSGTFQNPFDRVLLQLRGSGFAHRLLATSTAATLTDTGSGPTGRTYTWTIPTPPSAFPRNDGFIEQATGGFVEAIGITTDGLALVSQGVPVTFTACR
ncbi:hypothetical protein BH23GEM9_BH23GEM9_08120 [soil metagenome]